MVPSAGPSNKGMLHHYWSVETGSVNRVWTFLKSKTACEYGPMMVRSCDKKNSAMTHGTIDQGGSICRTKQQRYVASLLVCRDWVRESCLDLFEKICYFWSCWRDQPHRYGSWGIWNITQVSSKRMVRWKQSQIPQLPYLWGWSLQQDQATKVCCIITGLSRLGSSCEYGPMMVRSCDKKNSAMTHGTIDQGGSICNQENFSRTKQQRYVASLLVCRDWVRESCLDLFEKICY
jgi:hypothetical protein